MSSFTYNMQSSFTYTMQAHDHPTPVFAAAQTTGAVIFPPSPDLQAAGPALIRLTILCQPLRIHAMIDGYRNATFGVLVQRLKDCWKLRYMEDGVDVVRLTWHGRRLGDDETPDSVSDSSFKSTAEKSRSG